MAKAQAQLRWDDGDDKVVYTYFAPSGEWWSIAQEVNSITAEPWIEEIWMLEVRDRTQSRDFYSAQAAEAAMARIAPLSEWQDSFQR